MWGCGRAVSRQSCWEKLFNRGLKLHTDNPWDGKCWGRRRDTEKSPPGAEGKEAAWGIFEGDWERQSKKFPA